MEKINESVLPACSAQEQAVDHREAVFQVALLQSLTQGYYDGVIAVNELRRHGDTGIGTFDGVNGEMILLGGKVYQALGDGSVQEANDSETVPFAVVTFFEQDIDVTLPMTDDINQLKNKLTEIVCKSGKNLFYMVRIHGMFRRLTVRSIPKQKKPYRSLDKALETDQKVFCYENITGTAVGLYCPDYMGGLNAPGWHLHFIADDKTKGGHILDLAFDTARAELDPKQGFEMYLPKDPAFQMIELSKDVSAAIRKVETNED